MVFKSLLTPVIVCNQCAVFPFQSNLGIGFLQNSLVRGRKAVGWKDDNNRESLRSKCSATQIPHPGLPSAAVSPPPLACFGFCPHLTILPLAASALTCLGEVSLSWISSCLKHLQKSFNPALSDSSLSFSMLRQRQQRDDRGQHDPSQVSLNFVDPAEN